MIKKIALIILLLLLMVVAAIVLLPRVPVEPEPDNDLHHFFSAYQKQVEEITSKRGTGVLATRDNGRSLAEIVNDSVKRYDIPVQVLGNTGESIELEIMHADKNQLLQWLAGLKVDYELHISSIKVLKSGQPDEVTVPQLVLVKASTSSIIR